MCMCIYIVCVVVFNRHTGNHDHAHHTEVFFRQGGGWKEIPGPARSCLKFSADTCKYYLLCKLSIIVTITVDTET